MGSARVQAPTLYWRSAPLRPPGRTKLVQDICNSQAVPCAWDSRGHLKEVRLSSKRAKTETQDNCSSLTKTLVSFIDLYLRLTNIEPLNLGGVARTLVYGFNCGIPPAIAIGGAQPYLDPILALQLTPRCSRLKTLLPLQQTRPPVPKRL